MLVLFMVISCLAATKAEVPIEDFFPFGVEAGDAELERVDDASSPPQILSFPYPFFDIAQQNLWVNENGMVSFDRKHEDFTPFCNSSQYKIIVPFWADVDTRHTGDIYYRQTTDQTVLKKGQQEITQAFSEETNIQLKWAFIATWHNVTYFQDLQGIDEADRKRNTFQLALFTDGTQSFALFYYNEITWTTGDVSGGTNGLGGTPAEVGYDFGDGVHYFFANGSCTNSIINITDTSNYGSPGKWIFRTNEFKVTPTTPPDCKNYTGEFCVVPNSIDRLGFIVIDIFGIQLSSTETALCRYYDPYANVTEVDAQIVTLTHINCGTPQFFTTGRVKMEVEVFDGGNSSRVYNGYIYVTLPNSADNQLDMQVLSNGSLLFKWKSDKFMEHQKEESMTEIWFVRMCEVGIIAATGGEAGILEEESEILEQAEAEEGEEEEEAAADKEKVGKYYCNPDPLNDLCTVLFYAADYGFNYLTNKEYRDRPKFYAEADAGKAFADICSPAVRHEACLNFILMMQATKNSHSSTSIRIPTDIPPCPPTLELAELDPRFIIDPGCSYAGGCFYNPGVDICYMSATPSPSGGGQHCCYKNAQIYIKAPGGGYPYISHPAIQASIPHHIRDQMPWVFCCYANSNEELCDKFFEERKPDSGSNYTAPNASLGNGDPHFTTFDGLYYTFNGAGEFWLLKNSTEQPIAVQARMILPGGRLTSGYSSLGAYALKSDKSAVLQLEVNPFTGHKAVYYDRIPVPDSVWMNSINFDDIYIGWDGVYIIVTFSAGISFKFGGWTVTTYIGDNFKGNYTHGLLGIFDGNPFNDLTSPDGVLLPANSSTEVIHYKFGLKWWVQKNESMFDYFDKSYDDYNFPEFKPYFGYDSGKLPPDAEEICDGDPSCLWDLMTTGNATFANETRGNHGNYNNTVSTTSKNITMCPTLINPDNGYYVVNNYLPGSNAQFKCYKGFGLDGNFELTCLSNGSWNGTEPICDQIITTTEEASTSVEEATTKQATITKRVISTTTTTPSKAGINQSKYAIYSVFLILLLNF